MSFDQSISMRAGFWRRSLAVSIDMIVVGLSFQIMAAILFPATSGWIQGGGITFVCENVQKIPDTLAPSPPAGANFARQCRHFFFGLETARSLEVGRVTKEGLTTTYVSRGYMLDRDGHLINGVSLDALGLLALVAYLIAFETRTGATLGNLAMRIRVVDMANPEATGVRFRKIVFRYLAMCIGLVPIFAFILYYFLLHDGGTDAIGDSNFWIWFVLAEVLAAVWFVSIVVQIARKRDPVYDRIAGTAVVRV